jgi:hypothetical protein
LKVDWAKPGEDKWNYQRKRISHSFNNKGPKTVASLGEKNRKLKDLLDILDRKGGSNVQRKGIARDPSWAKIFDCIRCQANNLHSVLRMGWKCSCALPHITALQLQQRSREDSRFALKFTPPRDHTLFIVNQRKFTITVIEPPGLESLRPEPILVQEYQTKMSLLRPNFDKIPLSEVINRGHQIRSASHSVSTPNLSNKSTMISKSALSSRTQLVVQSTSHRYVRFDQFS